MNEMPLRTRSFIEAGVRCLLLCRAHKPVERVASLQRLRKRALMSSYTGCHIGVIISGSDCITCCCAGPRRLWREQQACRGCASQKACHHGQDVVVLWC